jgi:hypothetical protein
MKKLLLLLLALSLSLALVGAAWGAASAPPKSFCLVIADGGRKVSMSTKMQGIIKFGAGKAKFYSITGEVIAASYSFPITGSGHVMSGIFHFTLNGSFYDGLNFYPFHLEGKWDLAQQSGTCNWTIDPPSWSGPSDLTSIGCADLNLIE